MNAKALLVRSLIGMLVLMLAAPPPGTFAQSSERDPVGFSQEELDQMLAPIALYPDSLLAQVLVAATYPEQVEEANQWVRANAGMGGERLNDALDAMDWDLSVKALVPFPKVLEMMSAKRDWTQTLGEAFLAQEADVMDSVQKLRSRAHAQGNLKSTSQQRVVVKGQSIEIVPVSPEVVYVPAYNPVVVYGPWWYPSYPPYAWSPYYPTYVYDPHYVVPGLIVAGAVGFAAAVSVGAFWHRGWGHWDWGSRNVVVNVNRTVNINRTVVRNTTIQTTRFNTAVRQGRIGSPAVRNSARVTAAQRRGPSAASVQRGLQQRQTPAQARAAQRQATQQRQAVQQRRQAGAAAGRGTQGAAVRSQRATQPGQRAVAPGSRAGVQGRAAQQRAVQQRATQQRAVQAQRGQAAAQQRALRGAGAPRGGAGAARGGAVRAPAARGGGAAAQQRRGAAQQQERRR